MGEDIKQIQEYSRRKIIPELDPERLHYPVHWINLATVLSALEKSTEGEDSCFGLNFHHGLSDSWWITLRKSAVGIIEQWLCKWDLAKQTLEEQDFETQLAIFKLLGGK